MASNLCEQFLENNSCKTQHHLLNSALKNEALLTEKVCVIKMGLYTFIFKGRAELESACTCQVVSHV